MPTTVDTFLELDPGLADLRRELRTIDCEDRADLERHEAATVRELTARWHSGAAGWMTADEAAQVAAELTATAVHRRLAGRVEVRDGFLVFAGGRHGEQLLHLRVTSPVRARQHWSGYMEACPPVPRDASRDPLRVVPCTISRAQAFVGTHHRHHAAPTGGLWAVAVEQGAQLVGVAIVGRPVARGLQDGATCEVTRVCTLGDRNACSMLLAACRRAAIALGFQRLITYTLASEPGASLRGAGWREVARVRGRSWTCASRPRSAHDIEDKIRWEAHLGGSPTPAATPIHLVT